MPTRLINADHAITEQYLDPRKVTACGVRYGGISGRDFASDKRKLEIRN
jgi:hypothetical protein